MQFSERRRCVTEYFRNAHLGYGNCARLRSQTGLQLWKSLNDSQDINKAWENIKEVIKTSVKKSLGQYEWKQHKPGFDYE